MSITTPHLPPEILDSIIDILQTEYETLKGCCLVSKSWVPRIRKHLFVEVKFRYPTDLEAWKKTFPGPTDSPAYYTHYLVVGCVEVVTATDGEEGGWIRSFTNVEELRLWYSKSGGRKPEISLTPFHNFSSVLKSIRLVAVTLPSSQVFDLVCSFPLLEDLNVVNDDDYEETCGGDRTVFRPSTSPVLTGTLVLYQGLKHIIYRLLDLPNGLRFRSIVCESWFEEDLQWVAALVEKCSDTLEGAVIGWWVTRSLLKVSINFSRATQLKYVSLWIDGFYVSWITAALKTITPNHRKFQLIKIYVPFRSPPGSDETTDVRRAVGDETYSQWITLDRILVQLWESHAVRTQIIYREDTEWKREATRHFVGGLLPEMVRGGMVELVNAIELSMWGPATS